MHTRVVSVSSLVLLIAASVASAHHSGAMFDREQKRMLTGTVRQFQWTTPHCYIQLMVKNDKGVEEEWSLEMGAPTYLYANGWRPSTVKAGDQLNVIVSPLRKGGPGRIAPPGDHRGRQDARKEAMKTHSTKVLATLGVLVSALLACSPKPPTDARVERFASLPKWDGLWITEGGVVGISGFPSPDAPPPALKLAGREAPWNDAGRAKFAAVSTAAPHGKAAGWGYPMMMNAFAPMQFIITPEETLILNTYRDVRHVYTDGRPHPAEEDRWPTVWGDSIGHWEGDTLVIETVSVQNPPDYFFAAPPLSEKASYVERLRMTARDRIDSDITIEDPATLTEPWKVKIVYQRAEGIDRLIHDAYTNDRTGLDGELLTIEPPKP